MIKVVQVYNKQHELIADIDPNKFKDHVFATSVAKYVKDHFPLAAGFKMIIEKIQEYNFENPDDPTNHGIY